jgi:hypothetical protein
MSGSEMHHSDAETIQVHFAVLLHPTNAVGNR